MARVSLEPDSPHVCTALHGDGSIALQFRRQPGASMEEVKTDVTNADVFQLERKGSLYKMSVARFGDPFQEFEVSGINLGDRLYAGLFVCSHDENNIEMANFHNVRLVKPADINQDISSVSLISNLEILNISSGLSQVINTEDEIFEAPNWTRDGNALIYNQNGHLVYFDILTGTKENIDSGKVTRNNNDHVLSNDGSMLGISSHSEFDGHSRVYTVPAKGGQPKCITPKGPSYLHGWSPDDKFLVYTAERNGQFDIYRIPVKGGREEQLTNTTGLDDGPEYSPDSKYIFFNSVRSGRMQIWRMNADGSQQEQMTDDEYNNWFPHISPNGEWLAFISYLPGEAAPDDHPPAKRVYLRLMPVTGGQPKVIAYFYGGQGSMNVPSWSPDSSRLAFVRYSTAFS